MRRKALKKDFEDISLPSLLPPEHRSAHAGFPCLRRAHLLAARALSKHPALHIGSDHHWSHTGHTRGTGNLGG